MESISSAAKALVRRIQARSVATKIKRGGKTPDVGEFKAGAAALGVAVVAVRAIETEATSRSGGAGRLHAA